MKLQSLFLISVIMGFSVTSLAEEAQKASEMPKPFSEPASKAAKKRAHKNENKKKKELLIKLKNHESPEVIGNAKARVQIERTESNRQDYLNKEKDSPSKKK